MSSIAQQDISIILFTWAPLPHCLSTNSSLPWYLYLGWVTSPDSCMHPPFPHNKRSVLTFALSVLLETCISSHLQKYADMQWRTLSHSWKAAISVKETRIPIKKKKTWAEFQTNKITYIRPAQTEDNTLRDAVGWAENKLW